MSNNDEKLININKEEEEEKKKKVDWKDIKNFEDIEDLTSSIYYSTTKWSDLGIPDKIMEGIKDKGFKIPSRIQSQALPILLKGKSLIGQAQPGAGKTACFLLTMLCKVKSDIKNTQCICILPTREVAVQVFEELNILGKHTGYSFSLRLSGIHGKIDSQIVIGTPGSLAGAIQHNDLNPRKVSVLVIDEADYLMGQIIQDNKKKQKRSRGKKNNKNNKRRERENAVLTIKQNLSDKCQLVLFSATFAPAIFNFAKKMCKDAEFIRIAKKELALKNISQFFMDFGQKQNGYPCLINCLKNIKGIKKCIIFVNRKILAKEVMELLTKEGLGVACIMGSFRPELRDKLLADFKSGKSNILIATNVLARGIDVSQVNLVINFDIPFEKVEGTFQVDYETYIHRIGRSGRFGRAGVALTLVDSERIQGLENIAKFFKTEVNELKIDDWKDTNKLLKVAFSHADAINEHLKEQNAKMEGKADAESSDSSSDEEDE